jgi:uncharacterized protein YyaL (SSP411 family)
MKLSDQYETMRKKRGATYKPRTKHLDKGGWAKFTNRLFLESSPYLLQHAHNPVNWYPWGDEAFDTAKTKGLPVLLSIGYSTCHWCHVMEEESFEDMEIAAYINENYVAVKVDREERPDVDAIYMGAVQAIAGRGGWPMTVWLTADRKPFYGGTYFPARDGDRGASMGFLTLLQKISQSYAANPDLIRKTSDQLAEAVKKMLTPETGGRQPAERDLSQAIAQIKSRFDPVNGGVIGAPKFPSTLPVRLLLRFYHRSGDKSLLKMAEYTLKKMAAGGIYDQVGGGFHRYATDAGWLVPHFEKMLYDNALLVMAYLEGFQATGERLFKQIVDETLLYVQREMTADDGGFYSATDADSLTPQNERQEGFYFTWTPKELEATLGEREAALMARWFDITENGNFEGRSIANIKVSAAEMAQQFGISAEEFDRIVADAKAKLVAQRERRLAPLRDEKILTAWNGLMISAFARAGFLLDNPDYIQRAKRGAQFILKNLCKDDRLLRSYKDGKASHKAYLNDYAFFIAALLDLFEADPNPYWFEMAAALDRSLSEHYEDKIAGGFFMTADDHEELIAREKPGNDGAIPSGNAVAVLNLLRFSAFTANDTYRKRAAHALAAFSALIKSNPLGVSEMLTALDFALDSPKEVVIVSPKGRPLDTGPFLAELRGTYLPNRVLIQIEEGAQAEKLTTLLPVVQGKINTPEGRPVAYVCEGGICQLPAFGREEFAKQISVVKMMPQESI